LLRAINTGRCQRVIEDAHLGEQSGVIPIEMLVGDLASLELDDTGQDKLGWSPRGSQTWK